MWAHLSQELCTRDWAESAALLPFYGDSWRRLYLEGTSKVVPRQVQAHAARRLARHKATFASDTDATAHLRDRRTYVLSSSPTHGTRHTSNVRSIGSTRGS